MMPFAVAPFAAEVVAADPAKPTSEAPRHAPKGGSEPHDDRVLEERVTRTWYGWQILPGDGAAALSFILGLGLLDSNRSVGRPLMTLGEVIFLVNGPTVHALHDHAVKAVGSLGMRVLFPLGGHAIGVIAASREVDAVSVVGAGLVASAVDIALLAFDEPDPPRWARLVPALTLPAEARGTRAPTLTWSGAF